MTKYYPKIENQNELLKDLCKQRLYELYENTSTELDKRLDYELDIINKTNTTAIFIILNRVFANLSIKPYQFEISGLMGGSLVAYLCGFSNIDPIKYGLSEYVTFGILNKEPVIDIDLNFTNNLREKIVIEIEKFGEIYKLVPVRAKTSNGTLALHPSGFYVIPKIENYQEEDYSLLINKLCTSDYHDIQEFYKLDLLEFKGIELLEKLVDVTGDNLTDLDINNTDIIQYLENENYKEVFNDIVGLNLDFIIEIANIIKPKTFFDLVKLISFAHGECVWINNAEKLLEDEVTTLQEIIANRDDIFDILVKHGISIEQSYQVMENVSKGKGFIYSEQYLELFKKHNLPEWFGNSCLKIKYLFPRAHAINNALIAWQLLWFKIHNNREFNKALGECKRV